MILSVTIQGTNTDNNELQKVPGSEIKFYQIQLH